MVSPAAAPDQPGAWRLSLRPSACHRYHASKQEEAAAAFPVADWFTGSSYQGEGKRKGLDSLT